MSSVLSIPGLSKTHRQRVWDWRFPLALVILLAVAVRLSFLGHDSLSHDEAARANDAWSAPLERMRWFPPLQYTLLFTLRHTIGGSEYLMRLPSAVAGIACVIILFFFSRKYLDTWSGICVAAVAAVHPALVAYSRVVKEFSIEALMCVIVTWAGVEAYQQLSRRRLLLFLISALVGFGFMYTAPLIVGPWMIVLVWAAVWDRADRWDKLRRVCGVGAVLVVVGALWYLWLWGAWNRGGASYEYGVLRKAWPVDHNAVTLTKWLAVQSYGTLQYVLGTKHLYAPINTLIGSFELLLAAAALASLRKRLPSLCGACAIVLAATVAAGAMRLWPYGAFHTMTFLVPLVCLAVGCGLRQMAYKLGPSAPTMMLVAVCVLNPGARAIKHSVFYPSETEHLRPVLEYVGRNVQPGDGVFAYYATGPAVRYYWRRADIDTFVQPTNDRGDIDAFATRFAKFIADHERVWFVFTHNHQNEREEWTGYLKQNYQLVDQFAVADASGHLFVARPGDGR